MKKEKIIKIYGSVVGELWQGGEAFKDFEYYLEKDQNYDEYELRYCIPENVILYTKLWDVYDKITRDGDFDGGARIEWAEVEIIEWRSKHRARIYNYELTGRKDGNSKYFARED